MYVTSSGLDQPNAQPYNLARTIYFCTLLYLYVPYGVYTQKTGCNIGAWNHMHGDWFESLSLLSLKGPVRTAADDIHKYFFIVFQRK